MAGSYASRTALSGVGNRLAYIDRDARKYKSTREDLLAKYDTAEKLLDGNYWKVLAAEARAAWEKVAPEKRTRLNRYGKQITLKAREAHELTIKLSNAVLERLTPDVIVRTAAESFEQHTGQPCHVALHWNADRTNLHLHIIYAERRLLPEPDVKVADRNLFFDEQGKRCYKKKEILDENKQLRPGCSIVKKGEIYDQRTFSSVNQSMGTTAWLDKLKAEWVLPLLNGPLKGDMEYQAFDASTGKLPQQHVGKDAPEEIQEAIKAYNAQVRAYNDVVDRGLIGREKALQIQALVNGSADKAKTLSECMDHLQVHEADHEQPAQAPAEPEVMLPAAVETKNGQARESLLEEIRHRVILLTENGFIGPRARKQVEDLINQGKIPVVWIDEASGKSRITIYITPEKAEARMAETADAFEALSAPQRVPEVTAVTVPEVTQAVLKPSFDALIRAGITAARLQVKVEQIERDMGSEREIRWDVIQLPATLRERTKQLRESVQILAEAQQHLSRTFPPSQPVVPLWPLREKYDQDYQAYRAKIEPLQAIVAEQKERIQAELAEIFPHLIPAERQRQGYGLNAPEVTPDNITPGDAWNLYQAIENKCTTAGGLDRQAALEQQYADRMGELTEARNAVDLAVMEYRDELAKIPSEHREEALEVVEAAWAKEAAAHAGQSRERVSDAQARREAQDRPESGRGSKSRDGGPSRD